MMLVLNADHQRAIVIRHDGRNVRLVPMRSGRLTVNRCPKDKFDAEWHEAQAVLPLALDDFLDHARRQGASIEALKGLESLARRDSCVVGNLF